jgi:hypothetical protein
MKVKRSTITAALTLLLGAVFFSALSGFIAFAKAAQPELPMCIPGVRGDPVRLPEFFRNENRWHVFIFCGSYDKKNVYVRGFSCRDGHCDKLLFAKLMHQITRSSRSVTDAKQAWDANVTVNCREVIDDSTLDGEMCRERRFILERHREEWAQDVKWWFESE